MRICDCHVHVFDPDHYPWAADRVYTPGTATVADLRAFHASLGVRRTVLVQPSPYGADNRCLLEALPVLGARGVAVLGGHETDEELAGWHRAGVRGVRVNVASSGGADAAAARRSLTQAAERVAGLGWHVQLFAGPAVIAALDLTAVPVPVVIDHYGLGPSRSLLRAVETGAAYVKLSAPYRLSRSVDVAALARTLIAANPRRVVWGSDWPHTGGRPRRAEARFSVEPFRQEDDARTLDLVREWAGEHERLVLDTNPATLYDFPA